MFARLVFAAGALLAPLLAVAGGTASPAPPAPPTYDLSPLPDGACDRPTNRDGDPHQVEACLLTDRVAVAPGGTLRVGLHLAQDTGWHTYWKSNTEIGLPTDITWGLPEGSTQANPTAAAGPALGAYAYPVPQRFDQEGIVSYGYDERAFLFTEVQLADDLAPGQQVITAKATWLACEVMCIPGEVDLRIPVQVAADAPDEPNAYAPLFDHFAQQHPAPLAAVKGVRFEGALSTEAIQPEQVFQVALKITPDEGHTVEAVTEHGPWPAFVPIVDNNTWYLSKAEVLPADDGGVLVLLEGETFEVETLPEDAVVGGLFQLTVDGEPVAAEFTLPMPWTRDAVEPEAAFASLAGAAALKPPADDECAPCEASGGASAAADDAPVIPLDQIGEPAVDQATCAAVLGEADQASEAGLADTFGFLIMAFLGGIILNIMPCVLPVLMLKLYGLVEQVDITPGERRSAGLAYTGGVVASFLVLAAFVIVAQLSFGTQLGWGFQFQYPGYVAGMASVVFLFGLSMFGVFEIPAVGGNMAAQAGQREGLAGHFGTGIFATLLGAPCSAPLLGPAMGFAFSQPPVIAGLFFVMAGLGLAFPFLLVAWVPQLFKLMPQPGPWMDTFKNLMGFTLVATTVWLIDVLAAQLDLEALIGFVAFLAVLGGSAWIFGHWGGLGASGRAQLGALAAAIVVGAVGGWTFLDFSPKTDGEVAINTDVIPWQRFREDRMASLLNRYRDGDDLHYAGQPVFIDFTAEWCLTCKVNERTVIETEAVKQAMAQHGVIPLKADWTNRDENITSWLGCFERAGVPYYVVLPADPTQPAIPLGETLTTSGLIESFAAAAGG